MIEWEPKALFSPSATWSSTSSNASGNSNRSKKRFFVEYDVHEADKGGRRGRQGGATQPADHVVAFDFSYTLSVERSDAHAMMQSWNIPRFHIIGARRVVVQVWKKSDIIQTHAVVIVPLPDLGLHDLAFLHAMSSPWDMLAVPKFQSTPWLSLSISAIIDDVGSNMNPVEECIGSCVEREGFTSSNCSNRSSSHRLPISGVANFRSNEWFLGNLDIFHLSLPHDTKGVRR
ncbi:hypothetical protein BC938DRAFT_477778 [Jimgerdemannia flammicorona]|uniref:Uncharacterized protein n=1 Tax=Jimgerdemannia flammicorona TaxID=994334 RepID=A0A433QNU0_9FUNG|nr:hypothetical protein BC938DRAFT_477778 [Jimgerdemannia flammicorona]